MLDFSHLIKSALLLIWRSPVLFLLHSSFSLSLSLSVSLTFSLSLPIFPTFSLSVAHSLSHTHTHTHTHPLTFIFFYSFPFIQGDLLIALSSFLVPNPKYISPTARAIPVRPARMTIEVASRMYVHLFFYTHI